MKRTLFFVVAVLIACFAVGADVAAGPYRVRVTTDPAVVPIGRASLRIEVRDAAGTAVSGASIKTLTGMPGMYMGERETQAVPHPSEPGVYTSSGQFPMAGAYTINVTIAGPQGNATAIVPVSTGQSTAAGAARAFPWTPVLIGIVAVAVLAFVLLRMRRTGQDVSLRPLLSVQVLGSLALLALAVAVSVYAVGNWRRKGAMTPIEAQVMDMNVPAPEGTVPVRLAAVERKPLAATVTYSGQAVGYVEQDVYPRVMGVIEWMPLYVGDRVKKGQLLARLDTSQVDPEVAEKSAASASAQEGVSVAAMEYQSALAGIGEAEAEAASARGAVEEARANLVAVEQGKPAAEAEVVVARAELVDAREEIVAAEEEAEYRGKQLERSEQLFKAGAVSREELDRDRSEAVRARTMLHHAHEEVRRAEARLRAAQAGTKRADAEIVAARRKLQQAESQVRAQEARVRTARSAADAAKGRISQAQAMAREARAGLSGATTARGYAQIRAQIEGVVTQRIISPGVLVSPGQAILRIAQIQPIRVQANVPESDLARIRVGAPVRITLRGSSGAAVNATISSIQPSVDPGSRTGVVEAILPNGDSAFLPGHFATMEITTEQERNALVIPSAALQRQVVPDGGVQSTETQAFVWVAEPIPGQSGRFTVTRSAVQIGASTREYVAVTSGLSEGQQVIVGSVAGLRGGGIVTAEPAGDLDVAAEHRVRITDTGFEPSSVAIAAGKPTTIIFLRETRSSCGEELVVPALKITRKMVVGQPVAIDLPPLKEGELRFSCGMDMMQGKVIVR